MDARLEYLAAVEIRELKVELSKLRDERAQAVQQAVHRARMEWAKEDKAELARLKAEWQAETMAEALDALEYMDREVGSDRGALDATQDELRERLRGYRRQAEGGE